MVATLQVNSGGSHWYGKAKPSSHRRARRAIRQALRGYPPRTFTITTKAGSRVGAL